MPKTILTLMAIFHMLIALMFFCGSGIFAYKNYTFLKDAVKTEGKVVEYKTVKTKSRSNRDTYAPVFTFKDRIGKEHKVVSSYSSADLLGEVGDKILIRYDPEKPERAKIDIFVNFWGISLILGGFGLCFIFAGSIILVVIKWKFGKEE